MSAPVSTELLDLDPTTKQPGTINYDELWSDYSKQQSDKLNLLHNTQHGIEIHPTPGFVAKLYTLHNIDIHRICTNVRNDVVNQIKQTTVVHDTTNVSNDTTEKGAKIFLNIVGHSAINAPIFNTSVLDTTEQPDVHIPLSCTLPYIVWDKYNAECLVFDICVNIELINKIIQHNNKHIRTILVEFALLAIQQKCSDLVNVIPDISTVTYPNMKYKTNVNRTTPLTHYIRKPKIDGTSKVVDVTGGSTALNDKTNKSNIDHSKIQTSYVDQPVTVNNTVSEVTQSALPETVQTAASKQLYQLYYKYTDNTQVLVRETTNVADATHIVAVIDVTDISDINDLDVTLSKTDILIQCINKTISDIHIDLPREINDQQSNAAYSKKQNTLTLTVPIIHKQAAPVDDQVTQCDVQINNLVPRDWKTELAFCNKLMYKLCCDV